MLMYLCKEDSGEIWIKTLKSFDSTNGWIMMPFSEVGTTKKMTEGEKYNEISNINIPVMARALIFFFFFMLRRSLAIMNHLWLEQGQLPWVRLKPQEFVEKWRSRGWQLWRIWLPQESWVDREKNKVVAKYFGLRKLFWKLNMI